MDFAMTTTLSTAPRRARGRPAIIVSDVDHRIVTGLATGALDRLPAVAETLLDEMDRARIVPAAKRPADVAGLGSRITYRDHEGRERTVDLVLPAQADIHDGRISILTPVGAALIGLSPGQSFTWQGPAGHDRSLTVTAVSPVS
jgi:regulator of nucleoside diphosphate kinase